MENGKRTGIEEMVQKVSADEALDRAVKALQRLRLAKAGGGVKKADLQAAARAWVRKTYAGCNQEQAMLALGILTGFIDDMEGA